jgi:hypothetical protein
VNVSPGALSVTTAQKLSVTVSVSGSAGSVPAGTVVVSSGSYSSPALGLSSGSALATVPAGLLLVGSDVLTATYTPGSASSSAYTSGTGSAAVTVSQGVTMPTVNAGTTTYPTSGAPFQALPSPGGQVFVAEAGGVQVFSPASGGGLSLSCEQYLPQSLTTEGGAFAELSYLPNGVDVGGGIESPGAIFYNASALATCTGTGYVVSQGSIASDQGTQAVAVTPDGKFAFVSNEYGVVSGTTTEGNIGVVALTYDGNGNVNGGTLMGQISTGGQAIAGMLLSPDGTRLYATSEISVNGSPAGGNNPVLARTGCVQQAGGTPQINGTLTVINVATAEVSANSSAILATVDAGCSPVRMAETADNSTLWVAVRGDNRVLAFSTGMLEVNAGNALLGYADTGGTAPVGIALFRNQTLLAVANSNRFGTGPAANATILSVAYPPAASVVQTVPTGLFPREVNVGSDDATLYLSNYDSNTLEVITTK